MHFRPEDDDSSIPLPPPMPKRGTTDGANCAECPFAACGKPNRPVVGEGIENPDWLIVGEGPGQNEIALGRPFVGASGQLVNKALVAVGFPRDRLYITNATLCVPTPGATEAQKAKARTCCAERFIAEMAQFPEKPVLALGAIAAQAFLGDETTMSSVAGCTYEARVAGAALRAHEQATTAKRKIAGEKREKLDDKEKQINTLTIEHAQAVEANPEQHVNCDKPKGKGRCDIVKAIDRLTKSADKLNVEVAALTDEITARDAQATQMAADLDASEPLRLVVPSTHPAAILRGGSGVAGAHSPDLAFTNLIYDVSKVVALAAGKNIRFKYDIETAYTSPEEIEQLVEKILWAARKARFVAVDTETYVEDQKRHNALQTRHAKIRAIGLATPDFSVSISWKLANQRTRALVGALLADAMIRKVMHNRIYDCPVLANNGYPVRGPVDDTLLLHHCAFPGLAHGLQQTATMFYAMPGWKAEFRAGDDTMPDLTRYNAIDTLATARLHAPLTIAVKRTQTERAYEMDLKMAVVAAKMGEVGAPISREVNQQLLEQFTANMKAARERIEEKAYAPEILPKLWERLAVEQGKRQRKGDSPIFEERVAGRLDAIREAYEKGKWSWSISTSDHIIAYLKARGVPMYQQTTKGKTQCKKDTLEMFSHLPEVRAILDFRENQKLLSTFCYRMFDRVKGKKTLYGFTDTDGRIHPRWNVHRITSRWSAEAPSCLDGATEILTEDGWCRFDALPRTLKVAQYDKTNGEIQFVKPSAYIEKDHDGPVVRMTGKYVDLLATPDHRMLVRTRRSCKWRDVEAAEVPPDHVMPINGTLRGGSKQWPSSAYLIFLCAAQADGTWNGSGWDFSFKKKRKIKRLCAALDELGLDYSVTERTTTSQFVDGPYHKTRIYVKHSEVGTEIHERIGDDKSFGAWLLDYALADRAAFLSEILLWDGCLRARSYSSSNVKNADAVQAVAAITGKRGRKRAYTSSASQTKTNWQIDFCDRQFTSTSSITSELLPFKGKVYCVTVPSSYIVVRRGKNVMVVGNCQNWPKADKKKGRPNLRTQVVAPPGRVFVGFDMAQLEARIIALLSGDKFLVDIFAQGKDIHSEFARVVLPGFDTRSVDERKKLRDQVKRLEYGAFYGGQADSLHKKVAPDFPDLKLADVARLVQLMTVKMTGVVAWHQDLLRAVAVPPYQMRSLLLNRVRNSPLGNVDMNEVYNWPVQTCGAEIVNTGVAHMEERAVKYHNCWAILQIHDAVVYECDEDDADKVRVDVEQCFTQELTNAEKGVTVAFPAEAKIGRDWSVV